MSGLYWWCFNSILNIFILDQNIHTRFDKISSFRKAYSLQRVAFNFLLIFLNLKISLLYPYAKCYSNFKLLLFMLELVYVYTIDFSLKCEFSQLRIRSSENSLKWEFAQLRIAQVRISRFSISFHFEFLYLTLLMMSFELGLRLVISNLWKLTNSAF